MENKIMIMINKNWEQVNNLSDIVRIVKENIGDEFAQKVIFSNNKNKIEYLENYISGLELKADHLKELNKQLNLLEKYIGENKDGTDYMRGMSKAYEMIER